MGELAQLFLIWIALVPSIAAAQVDVQPTILPVLRNRCFECHAQEKSSGELRLDSLEAIHLGGHTGNEILGATPEESELFRRITSDDDGYRMPKEGPALTREEIAQFRKWIEQGALWPVTTVPADPQSTVDYLGNVLNQFNAALTQYRFRYVKYLMWPLAGWLLLALGSYPARRWADRNADVSHPTWLARFSPGLQLLSLLLLVVIGALLFQWGTIEELTLSNQQLSKELAEKKRPIKVSLEAGQLTQPPYPMHPHRLGGIYYRGNDERNPELFNGGFYRTATLEVRLVDERGKRLERNTDIPAGPMSVQLTINRAPGTTSALFSQDVLQATFLRHFQESDLAVDASLDNAKEIQLVEQVPGQKWTATIPIEPISSWRENLDEGLIYLFYGKQIVDGHKGRVHFGIKYKLIAKDGKISSDSELWMGSLYDLGGRILIPSDDEILLDHWFDFRPIPEIEGKNTDDPTLLGIPEHVK